MKPTNPTTPEDSMATNLQNALGDDEGFEIVLAHVIRVLDEAVKADPQDARAIAELIAHRVVCSDMLGEHPTIQVGHVDDDSEKPLELGMLGILNGVVGVNSKGWGCLAACYAVRCDRGGGVVNGRAGNACACGGSLVLGELTGFMRTP